ncbi:ArnT family glycosyltransferase [Cryptosporangium minutisporangium]|uniref:ArnT family glycosyltransferase n=1 Tax=Cryptosporangium minutisporangium TaxID=113569 RepID=UPI0035EB0975
MRTISRRLAAALPLRGWLLLGLLYVLAVGLALITNAQFGPDSRIYLAWTYWYLGHPQAEAAQLSYNYLWDNSGLRDCWSCWPDDYHEKFFTGQYAAVVGPRVLLPFLSAPFVALFGPMGMLVVPMVGYALAVIATVLLASRLWGQRWALLAGTVLLLPVYVSRWSVVAHTEGPAFALLAVPLLLLPLAKRVTRKHLIAYAALVGVGMLNRQFAIALPVAVGFAWLLVAVRDRKFRNVWLPFAFWGNLVGFGVLLAQMLITPMIFGGEELSLTAHFNQLSTTYFQTSGVAALPEVTWNIITSDLLRVRYDLVLMALLVTVTVAVVWRFRSELSALAAGAFLSVSAINIVEFWPASFRYHAPIVPLLVLATVALLADLWGPIRRRPSRSTETEPRPPANRLPTAAVAAPAATARPARRWTPDRRGLRWVGTLPLHAWLVIGVLLTLTFAELQDRTWHYGPSSLYHLAWSYRILGHSPAEATALTYDGLHNEQFFDSGCGGPCWEYGDYWIYQHATSADPNVVYPLLSAPFVSFLGPAGLLVVPVIALLVATAMLTVFAARRWGAAAATLTAVGFLLTDRIAVAGLAGTADMLAIALAIGCLFTLPLDGPRSRRALAAFGVLLVLALASRSTSIALVGAVGMAWLCASWSARTLRNRWWPYASVAGLAAMGIVLLGQVNRIVDARYLGRAREVISEGTGGVVGSIGDRISDMTSVDGTYIAADALLCAVLLVTVIAAPMRTFRDPLAALALGGGVVSVLLGLLVGVPSGARQFSTVYPLFLLTSVGVVASLVSRLRPRMPDSGPATEPSPTEPSPTEPASTEPPDAVEPAPEPGAAAPEETAPEPVPAVVAVASADSGLVDPFPTAGVALTDDDPRTALHLPARPGTGP